MEYKYKESSRLRNTKQIAKLANYSGLLDAYSYIKPDNNIVVIAYHRVGPYEDKSPLKVSTSEFEKQCRHLTKSYKIISLSELIQSFLEKRSLKKVAVITFDDGYKDNYIHAFPILKKYKIPATIFLTSGYIGTDNLFWWDKIDYVLRNTTLKDIELENFGKISLNKYENRWQTIFEFKSKLKQIPEENKNKIIDEIVKLSDVDISDIGKETILSWDDVKDMNEFGIDFGSHTVTHPILKNISLRDTKYEITFSKKTIESNLGHSIDSFSYPNGTINDFDDRVSSIVKDAGFKCAVTGIQRRMISPKSDLYKLERLNSADNFDLFKFYISGLYTDINRILNVS